MKKYFIIILTMFYLPLLTYGMHITYDNLTSDYQLGQFLQNLQGAKEFYIGSNITINNNIEPIRGDTTIIRGIEMLEQNNGDLVSIITEGPISDVVARSEGNKLILEIMNSTRMLAQCIRPFQNDTIEVIESSDQNGITTIEFTLKKEAHVETIIDDSRQEIIVQFYGKPIDAIVAGTDDIGDYIVLHDLKSTEVNVNLDTTSSCLNIKVPHNYLAGEEQWTHFNGQYIDEINVFNGLNGLEIDIDLKEINFVYDFEEKDGALFIRLEDNKPIIDDIFEISVETPLEKKWNVDKDLNILTLNKYNMDDIKITDNYRAREIIIDLGADYSDIYQAQEIQVNNQNIREIEIIHEPTTQFIIKENMICSYELEETDDGLNIHIVRPKNKYEHIIVLDIGHGGTDSGAVANDLVEKDINAIQAFAIKEQIEQSSDIKVYMTREQDETLSLTTRSELANEIEADLFISVHNNKYSNTDINGSEIFYFPNETDLTGKLLAENMIQKIVDYTGMLNRGAKAAPKLVVLRTSNMPALLLEGGFLSNTNDAKKLVQDKFTQDYALAVTETIIEFFK
ncbi:hypothetical protein AN641_08295 [Candidatus Epulonipiscioides gigas]|nr:hypothetical protein AN641_08295 [Epulopiscium sp. SCG-C07WGA-EpuloA2]